MESKRTHPRTPAYPVNESTKTGVQLMKVVVWKSPKYAVPFLKRFFKFKK